MEKTIRGGYIFMSVIELCPPKAAVVKTSGINCDRETRYALEVAGARADIVHLNELKSDERKIDDYQIIVIPGGFSYGDDLASGRVMAVEMQTQLADQLMKHVYHKGRLVLGICNGFFHLVQTGLLPFGNISTLDRVQASLAPNENGRFESRWVHLKPENSLCIFGIKDKETVDFPVAHGEGRFTTTPQNLARIENEGLVVFRYCDVRGMPTQVYPDNPNGSTNAIAGICDPSGRILGLMPHPERFVDRFKHPNWRRLSSNFTPDGLIFFQNIVKYAKQL